MILVAATKVIDLALNITDAPLQKTTYEPSKVSRQVCCISDGGPTTVPALLPFLRNKYKGHSEWNSPGRTAMATD